MARTAKIVLDGKDYEVHAFNIGELERITLQGNNAWLVLRIALERAEPKVSDPNMLEPTPDEVRQAFAILMKLAGLEQTAANPPQTAGEDQS